MLKELQRKFARSKNVLIEELHGEYVISIDKKSRFIMKDTLNIEEKLKGFNLGKIRLKLSGDICSKSIKYLNKIGISRVEANNT